MTFRSSATTDVGQEREHNEDAVHAEAHENWGLLAVADGMGGHSAGDVASEAALDAFTDEVHASPGDPPDCDAEQILRSAVERANDHVRELVTENPAYEGMGTTLVAALLGENTVTVVNVGDSRAYRVRDGRIEQVTVDQSLVQQLVDAGTLTPEEAEGHPHSNVVAQALGTETTVEPDTYEFPLLGTVLLCSDGLTDEISDSEIRAIVASNSDLQRVTGELVAEANAQGGEDNVSVVVARPE